MDGRLGLLVILIGILLFQDPVAAAALPQPKYTTNTRFRIPYKFDPTALQRMNAREVQLHVSRDHGATWQLAQVREPDGDKFDYQCPSEGEYWFAVKTLDGRMQLHPPRGSYETGLIVVVDNTPPKLDITLLQLGADRVQVSWHASDPNIDLSTLRLEYLASGSHDWELIQSDSQANGKSSWTVPTGTVSVRGSVADAANNVTTEKVQIDVGIANPSAVKTRPSMRGPVAGTSPDDDLASASSKNALTEEKVPDPTIQEREYRGPVITPQGTLPTYGNSTESFPSVVSKTRPEPSRDYINAKTGSDSIPITNATLGSNADSTPQPQFASRSSQSFDPAPANRRSSNRQRVVGSRQFQVGYAIEDVGPSGISAVELFITEDSGRKWWKYGDDPDLKSPFDVEVPRDGEYGFSIRVRSGAGLASNPPAPGERPEFSIVVDQTAPVVELLPVQQGQGANVNRLRIQWRISDDRLSDKPVSLYYSANKTGPWEPITGWKEDRNGMFDWVVGVGVPVQFYIKIMARDVAGNIGKAETSLPIIVDLSRPTAQIIDIEAPVGSGPQ